MSTMMHPTLFKLKITVDLPCAPDKLLLNRSIYITVFKLHVKVSFIFIHILRVPPHHQHNEINSAGVSHTLTNETQVTIVIPIFQVAVA